MFDGSSEQFHQHFIASSATSLPFPLPLHGFEPYPPPPPPPPQLSSSSSAAKMEIRSDIDHHRPWSNDELLSLLKLRSTMEIWFPDFTWEHVSRKLEELGFKRSAEQCKEKFEQETRNFNCSSTTRSILNDLDDFCHNSPPLMGKPTQQQQQEEEKKKKKESGELEENPPQEQEQEQELISSKNEKKRKKRKRKDEKYLERLKGLCEGVVKKMMEKQEHLHNQLIQELIRRDQEKIEREEAWKNQEMERIRTQFESRSNDHKSAAERQAAIIDFLNRFTSDDDNNNQQQLKQKQEQEHPKNNTNSNSSCTKPPPRRPPSSPRSKRDDSDDVGRRWPRDEVVALINLRCRMSGETEATSSKEKGPLWERISKGMMEMGYKRSGKRCKEKWENINKYFRKTKDSSKKRSLNSRTCPYFHHLNSLYSDGNVVAPVSASAAAVVELGEERDDGGAIVDVN